MHATLDLGHVRNLLCLRAECLPNGVALELANEDVGLDGSGIEAVDSLKGSIVLPESPILEQAVGHIKLFLV